MRNLFFILCLLILSSSAVSAQKAKWDNRLLSKYSEAQLNDMKKSDPAQLNYLNKVARNGWQIMDLPKEKSSAHELRGTVQVADLKNVNLFALGLTPEAKNYQYYRIAGTDKMLVVLSEEMIRSTK